MCNIIVLIEESIMSRLIELSNQSRRPRVTPNAVNVDGVTQSDAVIVTIDLCDVFAELLTLTMGMIRFFSEWFEDTPDEIPEVECFEALLRVEKPLWQDWRLVMDPL